MKLNLESIIKSAVEYKISTLNENVFSDETLKHFNKIAEELKKVEDFKNMEVEILTLVVEGSEDGFEEGFKTACNLIHSLLIPMKNSKDNIFNDMIFLEMVSRFIDINNINMYTDSMQERLDIQEEMILKSLPKSEARQLLDYTFDVNNQICAEGFATGIHIGIDMMKYLMK